MPRKPPKRRVNATGRNESEGQYIKLPYVMTQHESFRALSGPALKILLELRSRYNGYNNGQLSLSFSQAVKLLHLGKGTVSRAFKELQDKGFIKLRTKGYWYGRRASEWIVTDRSFNGDPPTRDWRRWMPPKDAEKQKSVPQRTRDAVCAPPEYRRPEMVDRLSTRHPSLRVIDGSA